MKNKVIVCGLLAFMVSFAVGAKTSGRKGKESIKKTTTTTQNVSWFYCATHFKIYSSARACSYEFLGLQNL